jgi:hypothetical protein
MESAQGPGLARGFGKHDMVARTIGKMVRIGESGARGQKGDSGFRQGYSPREIVFGIKGERKPG